MPPPDGVQFSVADNTVHQAQHEIRAVVASMVNRPSGDYRNPNLLIVYGPPSVGKTFNVRAGLNASQCEVETTVPTAATAPEMMRDYSAHPKKVLHWADEDRLLTEAMFGLLKKGTEIGVPRIVSFRQTRSALSLRAAKARENGEEDVTAERPFRFDGTIILESNVIPPKDKPISRVWEMYPPRLQPHMEALVARAVNLHLAPTFRDMYHYACWAVASPDGALRGDDDTDPQVWQRVLQHACDHVWHYWTGATRMISLRDMLAWRSTVVMFRDTGMADARLARDVPALPDNASIGFAEMYHRPSFGLWTYEA